MYKLWDEKTLEEKLLDWWTIDDIVRDEEGKITHIYLRDEGYEIVACLTYPHESNNNKFMMRAEILGAFDRWSNCSYEVLTDEEDIEIDPDYIFDILMSDEYIYDYD